MFDVFYQDRKPDLFAFEKPAASLEEAAELSRTEFFWYIHGNNDYVDFDFEWRPVPWEKDHVHVFPSQWQRNGEVYFARKWTAANKEYHFRDEQQVKRLVDMSKWSIPDRCDVTDFDFSWHPDAIEEPYEYRFPTQWQREGGPIYKGTAGIKYSNSQKVKAKSTQIFYMDFMNPQSQMQLDLLKEKHPTIKSTRYVSDHLTVFKRIVNLATTEFVWIISSICDYSEFDFSWHPEESQREMIHCFASGQQKRGDTFLINVQSFKNQMYSLELLDWFNVINYVQNYSLVRFDMPVHYYDNDDLISEIKQYEFNTPYVLFTNQSDIFSVYYDSCLWTEKDRVVSSFNGSNSICTVPRDVKAHLRTQMYDYPYVSEEETIYFAENNQDIIFISYDEPQAEQNWTKLVEKFPQAKRVHGVEGMELALLRAAELSETPWYYAVFAKTELAPNFDFTFKPDYFQEPKHYIFHSHNVMNGLEYGHMGIVMYNCNIVKNIKEFGIDYTLSANHEVVPIVSAIASFNSNPYQTWRTAFREAAKLTQYLDEERSIETKHRLKVWTSRAEGEHAEWCLRGARDGKEFYEQHKDDAVALKQAFDWRWLKTKFASLYDSVDTPNEDKLKLRQSTWQQ